MSEKVNWTGKALAEDLAKSRNQADWLTWTELPLGSVQWGNGHTPRADVLCCRKSFSNPSFMIYEVKISRSDFLADVNRGKYQAYFEHCCQLYFAAPKGLIKKEEVPEGTGLMVRGENGWRAVKAAPRREHTPSVELLLKLLMRGYEDRLVQWKQYDRIKNLEYKGLKEASRRFGLRLAHDLETSDELIQTANNIKTEVGKVMGKDYNSLFGALSQLKSDVDSLMTQKHYAEETLQLIGVVDGLFRGARYSTEGAPRRLRTIADAMESKIKAAGPSLEDELKDRYK
ncbi:hypothetical protein LCGC14_1146970 [marine sediment metagenome]|uniref:MmcB family DNA repair protein n=1 Tax=marine sediment metagenome TaxID=412755 RepID=A0A0F9M1I1_9ZZZZ